MAKCEQITTLRRDASSHERRAATSRPLAWSRSRRPSSPRSGCQCVSKSGAEGSRTHDHSLGASQRIGAGRSTATAQPPGLVDDPLDGDRGIDDGRPRSLSATHRVRGRIRTVLSVAWPFRVRRVAARLAAARRAKACRFFKTESDSRRRISSSTDRPCARARVRRALATRSSRLRTLNSAMLGRCHLTPPGVNGRAAATSVGSRRACARPTPTSASAFPPARTLGDTCRPARWRPRAARTSPRSRRSPRSALQQGLSLTANYTGE